MSKRVSGSILVGVMLFGAALIAQKANLLPREGETLIEVHGPNTPSVPMTEKFVKYDGKIRKIAKFAQTIAHQKEDCRCPKCCDGYCYVIIYTDLAFPGGPIRTLYILWIECD